MYCNTSMSSKDKDIPIFDVLGLENKISILHFKVLNQIVSTIIKVLSLIISKIIVLYYSTHIVGASGLLRH